MNTSLTLSNQMNNFIKLDQVNVIIKLFLYIKIKRLVTHSFKIKIIFSKVIK